MKDFLRKHPAAQAAAFALAWIAAVAMTLAAMLALPAIAFWLGLPLSSRAGIVLASGLLAVGLVGGGYVVYLFSGKLQALLAAFSDDE